MLLKMRVVYEGEEVLFDMPVGHGHGNTIKWLGEYPGTSTVGIHTGTLSFVGNLYNMIEGYLVLPGIRESGGGW